MRTKLLVSLLLYIYLGAVYLSAQTIDVHTHIIIPEYMKVLKAHDAELEETFPLPVWNAERHIAFMDSADIRTAVLTMPAPQPYYDNVEESAACIRKVNEESAKIKQKYPTRFLFCAALPLPNVEAAIREAVYAFDALKVNLQKLKQTIVSDKELAKYADLIFWKNAESLFVKSEVSDSIPTE